MQVTKMKKIKGMRMKTKYEENEKVANNQKKEEDKRENKN